MMIRRGLLIEFCTVDCFKRRFFEVWICDCVSELFESVYERDKISTFIGLFLSMKILTFYQIMALWNFYFLLSKQHARTCLHCEAITECT